MRYVKKMFVFLIIIMICVLAFGGVHAAAEQEEDASYYKYYTSIQIEEGDTLWEIADRYGNTALQSNDEYIREIKKMNHLIDDTIKAGSYLTIIYYSQDIK